MEKERIKWIDVAKCFGMFAIYLGHCGQSAGMSYFFVFSHHVPLFFLLAGCTASLSRETSLLHTIKKKFFTIFIPFLCFALFSVVVYILYNNQPIGAVGIFMRSIVKGCVRNDFFASGLWFLSCIFVMSILFELIRKVRYRWLMLLICGCLTLTMAILNSLNLVPVLSHPSWYYNLDSALYYILYYCIGFTCLPYIQRFLSTKRSSGRVWLVLSGGFAIGYSALLFFDINLLFFLKYIPLVQYFYPVVTALIVIWAYIIFAKLCEALPAFTKVGQNSLYLCGSEYLVKTLVLSLASLFSLKIQFNHPLEAFVFVALTLFLANRFFVPLEKKAISLICDFLKHPLHFRCAQNQPDSNGNVNS